ncbi:SPOR domain-containing protein [Ideonella sp. BN130291]|uniref:SPOR domain-containing protein n=1 Tax=Ideonella sp. BN130291 TaxID=3112940 RepID=UPI002E26BBBC|nr:SPOR domain-containing protein [Ideonella sp. BN130291]
MKSAKSEKGGFVLGLIVGLLIGLALALGVALYVTKVPVPFVNKVPQRTPEQDAAEVERNKNWDPNAPLAGKQVKPIIHSASAPASGAAPAPGAMPPAPAVVGRPAEAPDNRAAASRPVARDPGAILSGQPVSPAAAPMVGGAKSAKPEAGAFTYFVQAGAFARPEDAEQQRAKLAMMGMGARVTEREQSGRTVYRVRLGPFDRKEDADAAQERLQAASVESALVRVEAAAH